MILHPGRGDAWWHGPDGLARFDDGVLWAGGAKVPLEMAPQVWPIPGGWIARSGPEWIRIAQGRVDRSSRDRFGAEITASRTSTWSAPPLDLPTGARWSPSLQPFPTGRGAVWASEGFVYRATDRVRVVCPGSTFSAGPHGSLMVGSRAASPTGSARPIPALSEPIRWREDGGAVRGMDGSDAVEVDLLTGEVRRRSGVLPVSYDVDLHLESGEIKRGAEVLQWGVMEASCALRGHLLAGPGGVIWDLRAAEPLFTDPRVLLGVTVAIPQGFATVHWETGRGHILSPHGDVLSEIALPLEDEDVLAGSGADQSLLSAAGRAWSVDGTEIAPTEAVPGPTTAEVAGRRYAWNESGQLAVSDGTLSG